MNSVAMAQEAFVKRQIPNPNRDKAIPMTTNTEIESSDLGVEAIGMLARPAGGM